MPNIPSFNAPSNLGLQPTEIGVDAQAAAARRINSAYNQAGQGIENTGQRLGSAIGGAISAGGKIAVDQMDHEQISHGAKAGSELLLQKEQEWNDTAKQADPNDPSVAGKFREESLEPALEQFAAGFTTEKSQAWAERFVDQVRQHMDNKTTADMSRAAGIAVHTNTVMAANNFATAAYNDPSSLAISRDAFNHSLEGIVGSSPTLTADDAAAVRTKVGFDGNKQIVRAAIAGAVSRGGDWQKIANDPKNAGFVDGQEIQAFVRADKQYRMAETADAERARRLQKQQEVDKSAQVRDQKYIPDITGDQPQATRKDILNDNTLTWEDRQRLIGVINKADKVDTDNPEVKASVNADLYDPKKSLSDVRSRIMQEQIDGHLTPQTAATMRQLSSELESGPIKEPIYGKTMIDASKQIGIDEVGKEHFANFQLDFMSQYLAAKRAGNAPANALDVTDPKSMISQAMKPYMRDAMTRARDLALSRAGFGPNGNLGDITGIDVKDAPPKPNPSEPAGVPAVKDREVGKSYPTPMGLMRWTGTGWVRV